MVASASAVVVEKAEAEKEDEDEERERSERGADGWLEKRLKEGKRMERVCLVQAGPRGRRIDPEAAAVIRPLIKCQSPTSSPSTSPPTVSPHSLSLSLLLYPAAAQPSHPSPHSIHPLLARSRSPADPSPFNPSTTAISSLISPYPPPNPLSPSSPTVRRDFHREPYFFTTEYRQPFLP